MTMFVNELYSLGASRHADGIKAYDIHLNADNIIYRAHFPERPITPGVCIIQIALELLETMIGRQMEISEVKNVKFLHILSPIKNPDVSYVFKSIEDNGTTVKAKVEVRNGDLLFTSISFVCSNESE